MQLSTDDYSKKKWILAVFMLLMVLHVAFIFLGFYGNDDLNYARYAAGLAYNGISIHPATDHFELRWSTIYITAFFYKLFGINAFASALCALVSVLLTGLLLYKILYNSKLWVYSLAMLLFFFAHSTIFYMHRLLADSLMCFLVFWMYYTYRNLSLPDKKPLWHGMQFSIAFFIAVITKETIIIALPLFFFFFIKDIFNKKRITFWKYATIGCIVLLGLYLLYFKITANDFFYRYHVLQSKNGISECSFDKIPFIYTLQRIGYKLWHLMLLNGDLIIYLPAIAACVYQKKLENINKLDAFAFLFLLCAANFMTISPTSYVPLCPDPRHFIFIIPFAAIIGGPMLHAYFNEPKRFLLLPLFFTVATVTMFLLHAGTTKYLYLLITTLFLIRYIISLFAKRKIYMTLFSVGIIILLSFNYLADFIKPYYASYWDNKKVIQNYFTNKNEAATVFSADDFSAELSEFFMSYKTGNIKFLPMDSVKTGENDKLYYLLNAAINTDAKMRIDSLIQLNKNINPVAQSNNVFLFQINDTLFKMIRKK